MSIPGPADGQAEQAPIIDTAHSHDADTNLAQLVRMEQALQEKNKLLEAAERTAQRLARLQTVTAALAQALEPETVAAIVIEQGIAAMEACAGGVVFLDEETSTLRVVASTGFPNGVRAAWPSVSLNSQTPLAEAVRTAQPVFLESDEGIQARYPDLPESRRAAHQARVCLPLIVNGRAVGAIAESFDQPRSFTDEDRAFMTALAQQCAQALERARLYAAEKQARAQAEAAVHLRDLFFNVASHELRNPLTTMMGYAELLMRSGAVCEDQVPQRAVRTIYEQTLRLSKMIDALLDVSRIDSGKLVLERGPVDLGALTRRLIQDFQPGLRHHQIELTQLEPVSVDGDELRLEQVLQNLLQNAVKYSPRGGLIQVQIERRGSMASLSVQDHGIGIPTSALPHLFDRFYRAENADRLHILGLGIGLYIIKEIVSLHGGTVQVESQEGQGARFTILLPLVAEP